MGGTWVAGRRALGLVAVVVLGLGAAACGGDDSDDAAPTTEADVADDGDGGDGGGDDMVDVDEVPGLSGDCEELVSAYLEASSGLGSVMSGTGDTDFSEVAAYFSEVADELPDEISDDFEIFAQAYAEFAQALEDAGIDLSDMSEADPAAMQALAPALEAFDDPAVQEASNNISAWMEANCGQG
jgi:hypothetical protein